MKKITAFEMVASEGFFACFNGETGWLLRDKNMDGGLTIFTREEIRI